MARASGGRGGPLCVVVPLMLGDPGPVTSPLWASRRGARLWLVGHPEKKLQESPRETLRGPELGQIPTDRTPGSQAGSRGGQREVRGSGCKTRTGPPRLPPALQIVARRPGLGRGAGRRESSCQPAQGSSTGLARPAEGSGPRGEAGGQQAGAPAISSPVRLLPRRQVTPRTWEEGLQGHHMKGR